jgi:hypothetical protein
MFDYELQPVELSVASRSESIRRESGLQPHSPTKSHQGSQWTRKQDQLIHRRGVGIISEELCIEDVAVIHFVWLDICDAPRLVKGFGSCVTRQLGHERKCLQDVQRKSCVSAAERQSETPLVPLFDLAKTISCYLANTKLHDVSRITYSIPHATVGQFASLAYS